MAKIRVYELAKKLNMTNKVLLTKLKAMNIEAKSHMSSLEEDAEEKVRENLYGKKNKITDTRVQSSVIRRRRPQKTADIPDTGSGADTPGEDAVKDDAAFDKAAVQEESLVKKSVKQDAEPETAIPESRPSEPFRVKEPKPEHSQTPELAKGKSLEQKTKKTTKSKSEPARVIMKPVPPVEKTPEPKQKPKQKPKEEEISRDLDASGIDVKISAQEKQPNDELTEPQTEALKSEKALEKKPETEKKTLDDESLSKHEETDLEANHAPNEDRTVDVENDEKDMETADSKDKKRKKKKPSKRSEPARIIKMAVPIANLGQNRVKKEAPQVSPPSQSDKARPKPSDSGVPKPHQANRPAPVKPAPELSSEGDVEVKRSKKKSGRKRGRSHRCGFCSQGWAKKKKIRC